MNIDLFILMIKNFFINIFTYIIFLRITNNKPRDIKSINIILASIVSTACYTYVKTNIGHTLAIIISYLVQVLFLKILVKEREQSITIVNLIANAISYILFTISTLLEFPINMILKIYNDIINFLVIILIEIIIYNIFFRIKRFKKGFNFLKNKANNDYIDIVMINISAVVMLAYCLFGSYYGNITRQILIVFVVLSIIMLIMIQKTLTLYYKQKLLDKTIEDYKNEISEKDIQIQKLSAEKYKISKLNHEFYNRQKSLERKINAIVAKENLNMETANELGVMNQISSLTKEYSAKLQEIKELDELPSTDIEEIDDMFKYMQSECKENNIDFKLQVNGNIHHLVNTIIPQNKLVTLIGDHLRDAIIAVNSSSNSYRSIIAILGVKDNTYEFCVYDTGIEFEIDTLLKLGLEPATTHKETGGTGIGFMTTFETLKETNASLIIEEKHEMNDNDYTKAVIIRFDGKNEYKIRSYRSKQIGKSDRIIIEKI